MKNYTYDLVFFLELADPLGEPPKIIISLPADDMEAGGERMFDALKTAGWFKPEIHSSDIIFVGHPTGVIVVIDIRNGVRKGTPIFSLTHIAQENSS